MNSEAANPYQAPESNVHAGSGEEVQKILQFKRFSAWGVFGLTLITLSIYFYYWMYTRTATVNRVHSNKIPMFWMHVTVVTMVASQIFGIYPEDPTFLILYLVSSVVYAIFYLSALFKLKNRTQDILSGTSPFPLSGILTFFFSAIYLQYKINQRIDMIKSE